jgi:iron complex outermembrane receptor protein
MGIQRHRKNGFARTLSLALAGMLLISNTAWSQMLEEIVVTAQKRAEGLQDTPVAVTAFSGEQLEQAGVFDSIGLSISYPM